MVGFAHIVLHLSLCSAATNLPPSANVNVNLNLTDATGRQKANQDFVVPRGDSMTHTIAFDAPRGTFRVTLRSQKPQCSAKDFWSIISENPRTIAATLVDGVAPDPRPMLMEGTAPESFLYASPTFVLFPKDQPCDKPVGDPLASSFTVENDGTSYYVWMYSNPTLDASGALVALQVATPTGEYHYIRLKLPFPQRWDGFPYTVEFNVTEDELQWLATQPIDTLLCPRLFRTSVSA